MRSCDLVEDVAGLGRDLFLQGRSLCCENILPGEYEATLAIAASDAPRDQVPEGNGFRLQRRALYETTFRTSVQNGECAEIVLR